MQKKKSHIKGSLPTEFVADGCLLEDTGLLLVGNSLRYFPLPLVAV